MRDGVILIEGSAGDDVGLPDAAGPDRDSRQCGCGAWPVHDRRDDDRPRLGRPADWSRDETGNAGRCPALPRPPEEHLLPTFSRAGRFPTPFLTLYFRQLAAWGFSVPRAVSLACLDRYNGDMVVGGRGEILAGAAWRVRLRTQDRWPVR